MVATQFSHVRAWVFDLDNTLYPPTTGLFPQIQDRMTGWVMNKLRLGKREADALRQTYWARYGTTLSGLMREHGIDPLPFLAHVHDIDFSELAPDPNLRSRIADLPGRRIVYTNADTAYAHRVLAGRGLDGLFDAVYGVEDAEFLPKPERKAFERIFSLDGLDPTGAAMFEDDPKNLLAPHEMGMKTVHVAPEAHVAPHIHHHTDDLAGFLARLAA
ncbi:pyrimidine 5'-nucleotidase [Neotabrizicola shimadae]|uniref:Pyrimidine 5'-nucleotidase n=1 Tax=Neotabrizicola shimadae TaxID=2807096 RepID=A0A8G0ZTL8_9RHOB|nr:pyrimidine 5'-nucleotidase [Neotabrizicola shimadae]QYZ68430.1 pyrimidine 5'-nucleotidase [Neotabrizicola shimadae]